MFNDLGFFHNESDEILCNQYVCMNKCLFMSPHPIPQPPFDLPKGTMLGNKDTAFCFSKLVNFVLKNIIWSMKNLHFPFSPTFCSNCIYYIENIKFSNNLHPETNSGNRNCLPLVSFGGKSNTIPISRKKSLLRKENIEKE